MQSPDLEGGSAIAIPVLLQKLAGINLTASLPEHGVTLSPNLAVIDEQRANKPLLLIQTYAPDVDLDATLKQDGWAATPADRMVQLCRSLSCRLGLVTNGERWMLVDAPVGAVSTFASWYARIWSQELITLQAFVHLLGIEHENLRLLALGGSLFDPDRFPFLEGRAKGSNWRSDTAKPLPIDNRTVLLLLEAIQQFQGRTLSYRALDVEQIGYVYEGL